VAVTDIGHQRGAARIVAIATETAGALFTLGTYRGASRRLAGLTWGAEDLSAELGGRAVKDADGGWLPPYQLARSLCLAGAVNAEVAPIDTVFSHFRDRDGLLAECAAAARDGFLGKHAIHPDQIAPINQAYTPDPGAIAEARAIVAAFREAGNAGVVGVGGKMHDRPHLKRAERLLALADRFSG
jgi:citrate lyase subunit beta/citryl-CoA lyase